MPETSRNLSFDRQIDEMENESNYVDENGIPQCAAASVHSRKQAAGLLFGAAQQQAQ
jgi:hypothetical protein